MTVEVNKHNPDGGKVEIRISNSIGRHGGALIDKICMECGKGRLQAGDWAECEGLAFYSGSARYSKSFTLERSHLNKRIFFEAEDICSSVVLRINGIEAGCRAAAPWIFELTQYVREGRNDLELEISNTLYNHYKTVPTRYRNHAPSGLLGQCILKIWG